MIRMRLPVVALASLRITTWCLHVCMPRMGKGWTRDMRSLVPDVLAFLVGECTEEIVEVTPAVFIAPVELPIEAWQPVPARECIDVRGRGEIEMRRRQSESRRFSMHRLDEHRAQLRRVIAVAGKQARTTDGLVRHRAKQLGVVVEPVLRVSVRPAPVENEFPM